ncbi:MAG: WD40/YVTN/BNR-like repeat-containing protein [Nevskiales bacterium]
MSKTARSAAAGRRDEGSAFGSWPAYLVVSLVLAAAVYSFSPRPNPPFPPTQIEPDGLQINGLARDGSRLIAVGELGHILYADDSRGPWKQAKIEPQRGSLLTQVAIVGDGVALAVGHDGWILRSEDRGETWREVVFSTERSDPLLGIAGPYDGKIFAFGGFGLFVVSSDQGQTWQPLSVAKNEAPSPAAADADPFANAGSGIADRHLNAMTRASNGALLLVGEKGLMLRSTDNGETWQQLPEVYPGSFFGILSLPSNTLVVFGMRGNAFRSQDFGQNWKKSEIPEATSLFGGAVTGKGEAVLIGDGNTVLISHDDGVSFTRSSRGERRLLAGVLPLSETEWLTTGEGGVRRLTFDKDSSAAGERP